MEHLQRDQTGLRDYSSPATGRHYEAIRPGGHAVLPLKRRGRSYCLNNLDYRKLLVIDYDKQ
jgi:hypothetical protein